MNIWYIYPAMRQYLPTDSFIYKNIQTDSDKKVVYLSGLGMDIRQQREGFVRRFVLSQGVSYLALDSTKLATENQNSPDYQLGTIMPKTMDVLAQDNKKLFLCGVCYGGLNALKIAAQIPERVAGVIVFAPLYETQTFPWIENTLTFLSKREKELEHRKISKKILQQMILFRKMFQVAARNQGRERILPTFQGPIHIFHGQKDRLIPVENSFHIQKSLNNSNCVLHIKSMSGHTLTNDFEMKAPIRILSEYLSRY